MYIADLHIHSRFSRATSKEGDPEHLDLWARKKGIHIVGTGDFTHPAWREELKEKLTPAEDGLYVLKEEYRIRDGATPDTFVPRFVLTGEISSIYKKNGRVRKVHNLILLPNMEIAETAARRLEAIGNIHSDGRPILGMDCRDLLEIFLETSPDNIFVPAHIWTPHFSVFGAFSGFDAMEECFEDLTPHIRAVETGLSSDPPMNWRVSALDRYHLISNSDAHSPAKLGREANLLEIPMSYWGIQDAIQEGKGLEGTIEFFPEEGKYHFDGHRKCNLCLTPVQSEQYGGICPVCKKKLTIGVSHRVEQLADRVEGYVRKDARPFESIMPLPEAIASCLGCSASSAKAQAEYQRMIGRLGSEFEILRTIPVEEIRRVSGHLMAEGIDRLRKGHVEKIPGFDGEYGIIKLFQPWERADVEGQMDLFRLFGEADREIRGEKAEQEIENMALKAAFTQEESVASVKEENAAAASVLGQRAEEALNREQMRAVCADGRRTAVIAGPGTGKTKTLVSHVAYLMETRKVKASEITAVTFTNQAAQEMKKRVEALLGKKRRLQQMQIGTFHGLCLAFLQEQGEEVSLLDEREAKELAGAVIEEHHLRMKPGKFLEWVSHVKTFEDLDQPGKDGADPALEAAFSSYQAGMRERNRMDFDDLLLETLGRMEGKDGAKKEEIQAWKKRYRYLMVDEFQDINPIQYRLMNVWNEGGRELFVIGDPDQSIYGFRGADAACFERLREAYPDLETVELVENYRSKAPILSAALSVISKNPGKERVLHAQESPCQERPVRIVKAGSDKSAAIFVAKEINRLTGGIGMLEAHETAAHTTDRTVWGFGDIAVLYRTHRQSELLESCLRQEGIPYLVAGRESFLEADSVQGSLNFFKYLMDERDTFARERAEKLIWNLEDSSLSEEIIRLAAETFLPLIHKKKPQVILEKWIEEQGLSQDPAMKKLEGMTVFYSTMREFLDAWSLGVESDLKRCGNKNYTAQAVMLMTLHGSKGLEFPVTILHGAQKEVIPLENHSYPTDEEEERRLLYVGMTRAREELILTAAGEESPFLDGLSEPEAVREEAGRKKKEETYHQMSLFE